MAIHQIHIKRNGTLSKLKLTNKHCMLWVFSTCYRSYKIHSSLKKLEVILYLICIWIILNYTENKLNMFIHCSSKVWTHLTKYVPQRLKHVLVIYIFCWNVSMCVMFQWLHHSHVTMYLMLCLLLFGHIYLLYIILYNIIQNNYTYFSSFLTQFIVKILYKYLLHTLFNRVNISDSSSSLAGLRLLT